MLLNLGIIDGGDNDVVWVTLYFIKTSFYEVNSKEVTWEERTIYYWTYLIWFVNFDSCKSTINTNQRNMAVESIGMLLLLTCYDSIAQV